jgi:transcription termination/antitermination protein NusG
MLMVEQQSDHVRRYNAHLAAETRAEERRAAREAPGPKWYIVQCLRGSDRSAIDAFERFKLETYYPTIIQMKPMPRRMMSAAQRRSGLTVMQPREAAVFPRYVFTRFDIAVRGWREAFDYAGVGLMGQKGLPIWMPDETIERVRARVGSPITASDTLRVFFGVGDKVMVNNGPFASFPGIVEEGLDVPIEKLDVSMRIKVAVHIFGRATPVELEYWQVSKT